MMNAYDRMYLSNARKLLANMFDSAINGMDYSLKEFYTLFLGSTYSSRIEKGDCSVIAGLSGKELARRIVNDYNKDFKVSQNSKSKEYWLGYYLAYYQWKTTLSFQEINKICSIEEMLNMYYPYHEMDVNQFVDALNDRYLQSTKETRMKTRRKLLNITQKELSLMSNVPLRTIQQYEQKQKDINKAQVESVIALAKALNCDVLDIVEKIK